MAARHVETKGELLLELTEKTTSITIQEFGPLGARVDYNLQGEVKGKYNALHVETVNLLFKPDGTAEWEARVIETTDEGDPIFVSARGKGYFTSPTMLKAEVEWYRFLTRSQKLAWLNSSKARAEGMYNAATGEYFAKVYIQ